MTTSSGLGPAKASVEFCIADCKYGNASGMLVGLELYWPNMVFAKADGGARTISGCGNRFVGGGLSWVVGISCDTDSDGCGVGG